ncbi:HAD family hydrolase [Lentilactobacillus kisonensis]|nr:HAD hydrolase-like protein [Lentilactobacillus kisonensis]
MLLRKPFDGINDLLHMLHEHDVITPMITGKGEQSLQTSLDALGLNDQFDPVMSGSPDGSIKSQQFAQVLKQYDQPKEQMAYIGDATADIEACQNAGITCYTAAWSINAKPDEMEKLNPGNVFTSVEQLRDKLLES